MCARLAYPKGDARDEEMLTRSKGKTIFLVGKGEGIFWLDGVEKNRYRKPVMAAKVDWIVFRTIE